MAKTVWETNVPTALKVYGNSLLELARQRPGIFCLGADLTGPTETDLLRDELPRQFANLGIAEANLMGVAAGMARSGAIPFVNTFGVFATRRAFDQIAMQIAYPAANVKIVGFMPGLTTPGGVTHQAIEDVALMRALPNMTVIEPCDADQIAHAVRAATAITGPVYLRIKRGEIPILADSKSVDFEVGKAQPLREGADGHIFTCGLMTALVLEAVDKLASQGVHMGVTNLHTIKPIDRAYIADRLARTPCALTVENPSIIGGLFSAIAEVAADSDTRCRISPVGIRDTFAEGASASYLFDKYGLSVSSIVEQAVAAVAGQGIAPLPVDVAHD